MNATTESGGNRLLIETIGAGVFAIALGGVATGLSYVALNAGQRTAGAFYIGLLTPCTFACLAVWRLRHHGKSFWSMVLVLLAGLIVTGMGSFLLDQFINCHFGNCRNLVDG